MITFGILIKFTRYSEITPTIYHDWKIAFVVNIAQETEDGKAVLRLDFTCASSNMHATL